MVESRFPFLLARTCTEDEIQDSGRDYDRYDTAVVRKARMLEVDSWEPPLAAM
jgi:hypothetical protein